MPLRRIVYKHLGKKERGMEWDRSIPTFIQRADDGFVRLGTLAGAQISGTKSTCIVTTETGRSIRGSEEHPFLTDEGWFPLTDLREGLHVMVSPGRQTVKDYKPGKGYYRQIQGLHHHPYANQRRVRDSRGYAGHGFIVPEHRLIAEAKANDLDYAVYLARIRSGDLEGLEFLDPSILAVHHIDGDTLNNHPDNLAVLSHREHWSMEGREKTWRNVALRTGWEKLDSIKKFGSEETFDLTLLDDPHNYIANGFVVHNSGKSLLGESIRRVLNARALYSVSTIQLETQLADHRRGFPYAAVIHGRDHFPTFDYPERFTASEKTRLTAGDCNKSDEHWCRKCELAHRDPTEPGCPWCHGPCPYEVARSEALNADLTIANYSFLLTEINGPGRFAKSGHDLLIGDEVDTVEDVLLNHIECTITPGMQKYLDIRPPTRKTVTTAWEDWMRDTAIPALKRKISSLSYEADGDSPAAIATRRRMKTLSRLRAQAQVVQRELPTGGWILSGYEPDRTGYRGAVTFRAIRSSRYGSALLWRHFPRILLMSATIISPDQLAFDLGFADRPYAFIDVPSSFPRDSRPIYVAPIANMTRATADTEWPKAAAALAHIVERHPGERILVHSVSYALTEYLVEYLRSSRVVSYTRSQDRESALGKYLAKSDAVLIAPSYERGLDLPDDLCRVIVLVKVQYPSLGDKMVQARLYEEGHRFEGSQWYATKTIRSLCQATSRGFRHEDDACSVYVLDEQFVRLFNSNRRIIPRWWQEALVWHSAERKQVEAAVRRAG